MGVGVHPGPVARRDGGQERVDQAGVAAIVAVQGPAGVRVDGLLRPGAEVDDAAILRILCRNKPMETIDFDHLANKTDHFSGADLKAVVDQAIEHKLREAMQAGVPKPLSTKDLAAAAAKIRPSTKEWFSTARNYALYSNQGGLYDDILRHLKIT